MSIVLGVVEVLLATAALLGLGGAAVYLVAFRRRKPRGYDPDYVRQLEMELGIVPTEYVTQTGRRFHKVDGRLVPTPEQAAEDRERYERAMREKWGDESDFDVAGVDGYDESDFDVTGGR